MSHFTYSNIYLQHIAIGLESMKYIYKNSLPKYRTLHFHKHSDADNFQSINYLGKRCQAPCANNLTVVLSEYDCIPFIFFSLLCFWAVQSFERMLQFNEALIGSSCWSRFTNQNGDRLQSSKLHHVALMYFLTFQTSYVMDFLPLLKWL